MIKLYGFDQGQGVQDPSPFVLKVHTFLRLAELEYETVNHFSNLQKAPKGKLPFIEVDGQRIADSCFIVDYLTDQYHLHLDHWLSEDQKAAAYFVRKTIEEHFYWCLLYSRWVDDQGWKQIKQSFFGKLPLPLRLVVPDIARKGVIKAAKAQGMGRHNRAEVLSITEATLQKLSAFLGAKTYFMGEQHSSLDATAFGSLAQLILMPMDSDFSNLARQYSNLVAYCERMQRAWF